MTRKAKPLRPRIANASFALSFGRGYCCCAELVEAGGGVRIVVTVQAGDEEFAAPSAFAGRSSMG